MNKFDYFLYAFNRRAYTKKAFLLSIFTRVQSDQNRMLTSVPYALMRDDETNTFWFYNENNERTVIDGHTPDKTDALFHKKEIIIIPPRACRFIANDDTLTTTIGRVLANVVILYEAFQGKVPYINGPIDSGTIKGIIRDLMVDNPPPGESVPENKASIAQCHKVTKQLVYLSGLNNALVKVSSTSAFTVDPEVIALRNKRFEELEKQGLMNNPVAISKVIDEVVELDMKHQLNGSVNDLYIKKGYFDNNRKKMFLLFDYAPDFITGKYELLKQSLNEGWELSRFNGYCNTAIDGSYSRSSLVGNAGYEVKTALLLTNRIRAIAGDCGSTRCEAVTLSKRNFSQWVGGFWLDKDTLKVVEKGDLSTLDGKTVQMRVPQYCKQGDGNLCFTCCGQALGSSANRVSPNVTIIYTRFFLLNMKKAHVSVIKTKKLRLDDIIR